MFWVGGGREVHKGDKNNNNKAYGALTTVC